MIPLTHLKIQQVLSRMVPDGVYLDADGLAEVDLGNGTNYNPQEALNMFFQTGSIIGSSYTMDGDPNPGKIPIQEIGGSGAAGNKIQYFKRNGGFFSWHCERGNRYFATRAIVYMTYLNTVKDKGETEFKYYGKKVKAKKGLTLLWPPDFTHTHRGIPSPTEEKYIVTGWCEFEQ